MIARLKNIPQKKLEPISIEKQKFYKNNILDIQEFPDSVIKLYYDKSNPYANINKIIIDLTGIKEPLRTQLVDYHYLFLYSYKEKFYKEYLEGKKTVNNNFSLKIFRIQYKALETLVNFLKEEKIINIFELDNEQATQKFIKFSNKDSLKIKNHYYSMLIVKVKNTLEIYYDEKIGFEKDIWFPNIEFNLSDNRINKSSVIYKTALDFRNIKNKENNRIIKDYAKYLITLTNYCYSTIMFKVKICIMYSNKILKEKKILETDRNDIEKFINYTSEKYERDGEYVCELKVFFEWLAINNMVDKIYVYENDFDNSHGQKFTAVDDYVINQIFNNLDKIDEKYRLIFLLNYSTGLRISEICLLKRNLLYTENNHYYIQFFSQKMQKEATNEICQTLYKMLKQYIESIKNNKCEFLFTSPRNEKEPILTSTVSRHLNDEFKKIGIKDIDGNIYKYKSHSYRHTIATKMVELDIPIQIIQKVLHHESPEMTLAYAEIRESHKIRKFKDFVNAKGELAPLKEFKNIEEELITAEWVRQNINAQILPNGYCGMPIKLGKCPHANSCLECDNFRTSIEFLEQHKKQLEKTKELIMICEQNNWLPQLETNKKK